MASKAIGFLNFKFGADLKGFDRAMKKAQKNLKKFGKNIQRTGENLTTGLTLPILGLGAASLKLASDFEETDAKFKTVFSSIQAEAEQTAKVFAESFGLSQLSAKQLLSDTGDLLVGFGFTEKSALDLSKQVNELAVDLASFTNFSGGAEGASAALTKALLGERESIKSLGIAITETDLKKFAADQGLVWKELDRVTKAQLTFDLALKQSSKAVGDFQRTQDGFANQVRITKGELTDAAISLGEHLLPMAQKAIAVFRGLIEKFNSLSVSTKENIVKWGLIVAAIGPALIIFGKLAVGISALIPIIKGVGIAFSGLYKIMLKNPYLAIGALIAGVVLKLTYFSKAAREARQEQEKLNAIIENRKAEKLSKTDIFEKVKLWETLTKTQQLNLIEQIKAHKITLENSKLELNQEKLKNKEVLRIKKEIQSYKDLMKQTSSDDPLFSAKKASAPSMISMLKGELGRLEKQLTQGKSITGFNMDIEQMESLLEKLNNKINDSDGTLTTIDDLNTAINNLGVTTEKTGENTKETKEETVKYTRSLDPLIENINKYSEAYRVLGADMEGVETWTLKLTESQQIAKSGFEMFGDVLTSSLDSALSSQENFFDVFVKNIKRAIQSLLVQLAVMTLISAIMPASLGGIGKAAFSSKNIMGNLGTLMNIPAMADGGVVMGPQMALIGEAGPEAVIPLDQLKNFGGAQQVEVVGKISGTDIFLSNRNTGTNRQRSV